MEQDSDQGQPRKVSLDPDFFAWKEDLAQLAILWPKYSDIVLSVIQDTNVTEEQVSLVIHEQQKTCIRYTFQPTAQDLEDQSSVGIPMGSFYGYTECDGG